MNGDCTREKLEALWDLLAANREKFLARHARSRQYTLLLYPGRCRDDHGEVAALVAAGFEITERRPSVCPLAEWVTARPV